MMDSTYEIVDETPARKPGGGPLRRLVKFFDSVLTPTPNADVTTVPDTGPRDVSTSLSSDDESNDSSPLISHISPPREFQAPVVESQPIKTVVTLRDSPTPKSELSNGRPLILFRGPKNPLSAFFHHPLRWKNRTYISAELAYQHEMLQHHKVSRTAHNELLRCRSSHDAKRIASKWVPQTSKSWQEIRFLVMEQICIAKFAQCHRFKTVLRKSGTAYLVHNTESDPIWGCGYDFQGRNMMGQILMKVRQKDTDYQTDFPPLPASSERPTPPNPTVRESPKPDNARVLVIGNSNARGISKGLIDRGLDSSGFVYPGRTTSQIKGRVRAVSQALRNARPNAVLVHTGDIEIRDRFTPASAISIEIRHLLSEVKEQFPRAKLLLSGLPQTKQHHMNPRISELNGTLAHLCKNFNATYICNKSAKLMKDDIHMTAQSKDFVARSAAHIVKQCVWCSASHPVVLWIA